MCETKSFYLWLLQVVVLLGLLVFLIWLIEHPKNPSYTIVNFNTPALHDRNMTSPVDQGSNTTVSFDLEIANPNKNSGIYYDDINVTIYYNDDSMGGTIFPSFYQGKGKTHQFSGHVDDSDARLWKAVSRAVLNGTAELRMHLVTGIKYKMWFWKTKHHGMAMQGHIPIGSDGKISGKKKKIKLRRASKKWKIRLT